MKRPGLILPILVILLLAGFAPALAGWFASGHSSSVQPADFPPTTRADEAMLRWQSGQWQHWRACLLQQ